MLKTFQLAGPLYGEWSFGECEGKCGIGRRRDTRECESGVCTEDTERYVNCRLPQPCQPGEDCVEGCDDNAECLKFNIDVDYQCECKNGYYGNGTFCSVNPPSRAAKVVGSSLALRMLWAFVAVCCLMD